MIIDTAIKDYVNNVVSEAIKAEFAKRELASIQTEPKESEVKLIRGLSGLAKFLGVSIPTAQKMKNDKVFPCSQWGRILIFKPDEVLAGMAKRKHRK